MSGQRGDLDVLVGSFGSVNGLLQEGYYRRDSLAAVAMDEADSLLDDTFNGETIPFIAKLGGVRRSLKKSETVSSSSCPSPRSVQLCLSCATYPTSLSPILSQVCDPDDLTHVTTHRLHLVLPHVRQTFVRCRRHGKEEYLMHYLAPEVDKGRKVVVFSNKASTANYLQHYLSQRGIACHSFNKTRTMEQREEALEKFLHGDVSRNNLQINCVPFLE